MLVCCMILVFNTLVENLRFTVFFLTFPVIPLSPSSTEGQYEKKQAFIWFWRLLVLHDSQISLSLTSFRSIIVTSNLLILTFVSELEALSPPRNEVWNSVWKLHVARLGSITAAVNISSWGYIASSYVFLFTSKLLFHRYCVVHTSRNFQVCISKYFAMMVTSKKSGRLMQWLEVKQPKDAMNIKHAWVHIIEYCRNVRRTSSFSLTF